MGRRGTGGGTTGGGDGGTESGWIISLSLPRRRAHGLCRATSASSQQGEGPSSIAELSPGLAACFRVIAASVVVIIRDQSIRGGKERALCQSLGFEISRQHATAEAAERAPTARRRFLAAAAATSRPHLSPVLKCAGRHGWGLGLTPPASGSGDYCSLCCPPLARKREACSQGGCSCVHHNQRVTIKAVLMQRNPTLNPK
jgi:hypothetical protein